ncbi:MAG: glycosyltransferase family 2 protein [Elusimicrobiota bacterium]
MIKLTVVVTSCNEVKTVLQSVKDAKLIDVKDKEIIIIDNCSTDGTRELLKEINDPSINLILQDKNYGFGRSVEMGLNIAKGKYTYIHHADNEYDYRYIPKMIEFAEKCDLDTVLGSRIKNFSGSMLDIIKQRPEYLATITLTYLINLLYTKKFTDFIGSRLYKTSSIKKVPIDTYGAGFDFESISRICKRKLKIEEIAIGYIPRVYRKDKKIKWYHMVNAFVSMFKVYFFES